MKWNELQRAILELDRGGPVSDADIDNLTSGQKRRNLSSNPFLVAHHFHKRIQKIFNVLKTSKSLGKYRVKDYFYRVEFQLRGKCKIIWV